MSRIPRHEIKKGDLHRIALLAREVKFEPLKELLALTKKDVVDKLSKLDSPEFYRNQGIYQFLEELRELFEKGLDW